MVCTPLKSSDRQAHHGPGPALSWRVKAWLGAEILLEYARVRWLLKHRGLSETVDHLRASRPPSGPPLPLADVERNGRRLGRAVERVLRPLPANTMCLMSSLVLMGLLGRRRAPTKLIIAAKLPRADGFMAHAWVELDHQPLMETGGEEYGRLTVL